ncbi:MAG: arylesterase [Desulfococcaceae bacterium]|jgi:lysophospholipase L1-like esterase|nr:arylesterase [Desulfococcaceae bacterium]
MKNTVLILLAAGLLYLGFSYFSHAPEIRNASPRGENIICFGDSLTYGSGASEGKDYPSRLSEMLGMPVINAGVPGDTTDSALQRLERDVLEQSPRIVFITLGGNDLKNGVPRDRAFANLKIIVQAIQEKGALVVIGGIDIPFWGKGFGQAYETLADECGALLIPNIFKGIFGKPEMMSDTIHPNDAGYEIMARYFYEAVKSHI